MKRILLSALAITLCATPAIAREKVRLLHVSYDATREYFAEINDRFKEAYEKAHPTQELSIRMSHGGSGSQARAIMDGLDADIASLALDADMDKIASKGVLQKDWRKNAPENGHPFHSAIVFVVRKGNPKHIDDWGDLTRDDVEVISANPKSSGGARWNVVAGYMYAKEKYAGDDAKIRDYLRKSFTRARVMDAGARGATTSFVRRRIGDVLVTWESEAKIIAKRFPEAELRIITPSPTLRAEPAMAVLEPECQKHNTCDIAHAYVDFVASPEGKRIAESHFLRTGNDNLRSINDLGGWDRMNALLFADGAMWDQLFIQSETHDQ